MSQGCQTAAASARGDGSVLLQVLAHCSERHLAVVPQGGNSSLAGAAVPCFDEVVLSTAAMKKLMSFNEVSVLS